MLDVVNPGFWKTVDYIRRNYRWVEPCFGTKGLLRITRELMEHWRYAYIHSGHDFTNKHWYEHINEYLIEEREKCYATENYVLAAEEYEFGRDQFAEH